MALGTYLAAMFGLAIAPKAFDFHGVATVAGSVPAPSPPVADHENDGAIDGGDEDLPELSIAEAVGLFFGEVAYDWSGDAPQFRWVAHSYKCIARERGWPAISDKALSQNLQKLGCKPRRVNKRDGDGKRFSVMLFPEFEGEVH